MNLTLEDLQREAASTGFLAGTLEKALRLLSLLNALRSHPFLRTRVALKGGVALPRRKPGLFDEAGDPSVSVYLLLKALIGLGVSRDELARAIRTTPAATRSSTRR